ncbi:acyl-CoA dehydrogenase family protein [Rhodoplanes sp. Z2-YC6860]|uniref:acyl-CoA dehydrogenase family protein n=1 Tax=Rhodoplanes sp. Z2-YC6860 TaxID=674703 RepID=UPI00078CDCD7|nr:acyl-CoA dehydrogenase family protein [Rhodoplanes sp. Z2-YC6860]AMN43580.1 acyl-CoA dehydrogenase domain-containing protein [Rhodoplanes sp. Z2-YC6860]
MYDLHLSPEQLEFRDTVRSFVNDEVKPVTLKADRLDLADRTLPADVLRKASQMGLRTIALPEDLGGVGADALTCCIVIEELAVGDTDLAAVLAETAALSLRLFPAMTPEQGDRFLQKFLEDDDHHLACAEREPDAETALGINYHRPGSVERRVTTTATRNGNEFIINGVKDHVANATVAKLIAVEAQTDKGPALILVPRDTPGLSVSAQPGPRWFHGDRGRIELKDCRVPAGNLLTLGGAPDAGRAIPFREAVNIGIGRAAHEAAVDYSQLRVQGGRPIAEHQAIGTKLADIAIRLDVARSVVWRAAWAADHADAFADRSLPNLPLTTIAKVYTTEAIYRATKDAAECFGAMGVMRDMPLQKYIHDARVCLYSGDGAADDRLRIAEAVTQFRRGAPMLAAE